MTRSILALALVATIGCSKEAAKTDTPAKATPAPSPREMTLVYGEDFSSNTTGWTRTIPGEGPVSMDYGDGQYVVSIGEKAEPFAVASAMAPTEFDDVSVEVDAKRSKGDVGSIGVICRASNAGYYFADISATTVRIGSYAKEQVILSETNAPGVWKDGEVNRLRFDCIGDQLKFWVNGNEALAGSDARLPIGKIGVLAGGAKAGPIEVAFDNLTVKKP